MDGRAKGLIRALIYVVQFDESPLDSIDRVYDRVVVGRAMHAGSDEYRDAINSALESTEQLSQMIPQDHPEVVIRSYLAALQKRLEDASKSPEGSENP
jgi:hypothetical protein